MSHPEHHGEEHAVKTYFPPEEWDHFHKEDIHAAKMIILLMATIFTIGLVLYATIALISLGGNRHEEEIKRQNGQSSRPLRTPVANARRPPVAYAPGSPVFWGEPGA